MKEGVAQAWQELTGLDPVDVCRRSGAEYDADSARYRLAFYRQEVTICPAELTISGGTEIAKNLVERLGYFSELSLLNYLVHARTPEASGRWIAPADIRGMETYFTGSHRLPVEGVASRFARDADGFLSRGVSLGGEPVAFGDTAVRLLPMVGFPVAVTLWMADDEFPARAALLFDEICPTQVPIDVVWSIAMLTVLAMQM